MKYAAIVAGIGTAILSVGAYISVDIDYIYAINVNKRIKEN
jgi:hypothetical protein